MEPIEEQWLDFLKSRTDSQDQDTVGTFLSQVAGAKTLEFVHAGAKIANEAWNRQHKVLIYSTIEEHFKKKTGQEFDETFTVISKDKLAYYQQLETALAAAVPQVLALLKADAQKES